MNLLIAGAELVLDQQLAKARSARLQQKSRAAPKLNKAKRPVKTMIPNLEKWVKSVAERLFECEFKRVRPKWLTNPYSGRPLELDLYNDKLKLAIEINGRQHSQFVPQFHRTYDDYKLQIQRDHIKRRLCREHGVQLLMVAHNVRRSELEALLLEQYVSPPPTSAVGTAPGSSRSLSP